LAVHRAATGTGIIDNLRTGIIDNLRTGIIDNLRTGIVDNLRTIIFCLLPEDQTQKP
jgi:ABC-type phosphate/phosphonate transport system permease subunit